jgi:dienelactone hydrolase
MMTRRDALAVPLATLIPPQLAALDDAGPTKVFTDGKKPTDARLGPPKTLNGYFPFAVPKTKEAWEERRKQVREEVLVATGLWPLPEKTPLNPVIHGKIDRDGYTVEKVFFASMPGHYVSGNLYRPTAGDGKRPGVLCPHGHWANGRFFEASDAEAEKQMKMGAEQTREGAKYPLQARCAMLARLGFVVFHYDMVGNADSKAIPHREGFKDVQAELRAQNFMGLQTWNSIRALDFIESLPDVDPKRIGVTGASGGGTQTFMLCAVDDRPAAAFPAVMVSTAMQGGCVCENCSGLRVDTGNVELAALFAPKPLAMSGADDWTKEIMTKGLPELRQLYAMLGAPDKVAAQAWLTFPHNYAQPSREFMYTWFVKHLQGKDGAVKEAPFKPIPPRELSVYDASHPRPADELDAAKLREVMTKASDAQLARLVPKDAASLKEFRRVVGTALRAMVNSELPRGILMHNWTESHPTKWPGQGEGDKGILARVCAGADPDHMHGMGELTKQLGKGTTTHPTAADHWYGDAVPFFWSFPGRTTDQWVLWLHPNGKASLFENGKWNPAAKALLDNNFGVFSIDLLGTGELVGGKPFAVDKNYAGYTYGYNRSLLAQRVQDALTAISLIRRMFFKDKTVYGGNEEGGKPVHLVGWGEMGPVAILAKALAGDAVAKLAADMNQFRFEAIKDTADPMMLPGAVKYGGLPTFLALCAPGAALVHNHAGTASGKLSKAAYDAAGASDKLTRVDAKLDDAKVVEWLIK